MALIIGFITGAVVAVIIFWCLGELPNRDKRKKICANKGAGHRFHDYTEWVMAHKVAVYQKLNPPRGLEGHELHMARRCNKCGRPDTMIERTWL